MMTPLIFATLTSFTEPRVLNLDMPAARLETLVAQIGAQSAQALTVAPELRDQVGVVVVREMPPPDLLNALATTFEAQWVTTPQGVELRPNPVIRAERERLARVQRLEFLRRQLADRRQVPLTAENIRAAMEASRRQMLGQAVAANPGDFHPGTRALLDFASSLGPDALTALPVNRRLVYAVRPTRWQSALPGAATLISRLNEGIRIWAGQVDGLPPVRTQAAEESGAPAAGSATNLFSPPPANLRTVADVMVTVFSSESGLDLQLIGYAASGQRMMVSDLSLVKDTPAGADWPPIPGEARLTPDQVRALNLWVGLTDPVRAPASVDRRSDWTQATQFLLQDPANGSAKALLTGYARQIGAEQIVGRFPDVLLSVGFYDLKTQRARVPQATGFAVPWHEVSTVLNVSRTVPERRGNLLLIRRSLQAEPLEFNRRAMVRVAGLLRAQGRLTLDDLALIAGQAPDLVAARGEVSLAMAVARQSSDLDAIPLSSVAALRLYHGLTTAQRQAASNGGVSLDVAILPPFARQALETYIYHSRNVGLRPQSAGGEGAGRRRNADSEGELNAFARSFSTTRLGERTVILADPRSQPWRVVVEVENDPVLFGRATTAPELGWQTGSAQQLGRRQGASQVYTRNFSDRGAFLPDQFALSTEAELSVTLTFGLPPQARNGIIYLASGLEFEILNTADPIFGPFDRLPVDVRRRYLEAVEEGRGQAIRDQNRNRDRINP